MKILKKAKVSSSGLRLAAVAGLTAVLGACHSGLELGEVQNVEPQGSAFAQQLYAGYVKLSSDELGEFDYRDSDGFAMKATAAAKGDEVMPSALDARRLSAESGEELSRARDRLVAMLDGGRAKVPEMAAHAQVMFDCWMQEQEEGHQPDDISGCRNAFYNAVIGAEVALRPPPPPPPEPEPNYVTYYVVFFEFDSAELSDAAKVTLDEAAATSLEMRPYKIAIRGHADRAGPEKYNLALSEERARAVARYMIEQGAGRFVISADSVGESEPVAKTSDNVRDGRNRRAEVSLVDSG